MARKFDIRLFNGYAFDTEKENPEDGIRYKGKHPFGVLVVSKDGIDGILDYQITKEHREFIEKEPLFQEECEFTVVKDRKEIAEFKGSFADAFAWLIEEYEEYVVEA